MARHSRKSPRHARELARTTSVAAIARFKRAGRIEDRDERLYAT
jgi:hypothetical protein